MNTLKSLDVLEESVVAEDIPDVVIPPLKYMSSFVGRRSLLGYEGEDIAGPVVVCGRYGFNLCMSRSMGDRFVRYSMLIMRPLLL